MFSSVQALLSLNGCFKGEPLSLGRGWLHAQEKVLALTKRQTATPRQTKPLCQQQSSNCVHATELLWVLSSTDRPAPRAALRVLCDHRRSADAALVGCIGVINAGKRTNTVKLANNL